MDIAQHHISQLSERDALLLNHYTYEMDPDDWAETPLLISYEVINFLLKMKYISTEQIGYVPTLLKEKVLSLEEILAQIVNAQRLKYILQGFPVTQCTMTLYRGFLDRDVYFIKSSKMAIGQHIMIPYFLSTSIDEEVALRFTNHDGSRKCMWQIMLPCGFPLVFRGGGEKEVLLNMGAVLKCMRNNKANNHVELQLIGFSKAVETRTFWSSLHNKTTAFI